MSWTSDEIRVERMSHDPTGGDWTLCSVTGPPRWRLGDRRHRPVGAFDEHGALHVAVGGCVLTLSPDGTPRGAPRCLGYPLVLAGGGRVAAGTQDLRVTAVDLVTGETIASLPVTARERKQLAVNHGGTLLAAGGRVVHTSTLEARGQLEQVLTLAPDGEVAVVRSRGADTLRRLDGDAVRTLPQTVRGASSFAWSGRLLAAASPTHTVLLHLDEPGRDVEVDVGGVVIALSNTDGAFLVGGERGAAVFDASGGVRRVSEVREPLASEPTGETALVWVGHRLERLHLGSLERTSVGDSVPDPITSLTADPRSEGVFVASLSGALCQWDPRCDAVIRSLPRVWGHQAVTPDGQLLIAIDQAGVVSTLARDGSPRWSTRVSAAPDIEGTLLRFVSAHVLAADNAEVVVQARFVDKRFGVEWDDPLREFVHVETRLRCADGHVLEVAEVPADTPPKRDQATQSRGRWYVRGSVLPPVSAYGAITAVLVLPDEQTLLVGTAAGLLLRLERRRQR